LYVEDATSYKLVIAVAAVGETEIADQQPAQPLFIAATSVDEPRNRGVTGLSADMTDPTGMTRSG